MQKKHEQVYICGKRTVIGACWAYCMDDGALDVAEFSGLCYILMSVRHSGRTRRKARQCLALKPAGRRNWGADATRGFPQMRFAMEGIRSFLAQEAVRSV